MEKVALKPDHLLMDPDFEGYKLSLDPVPVHSTKLESPLEVRNAGDDQVLNKDDNHIFGRTAMSYLYCPRMFTLIVIVVNLLKYHYIHLQLFI